MNFAKDTSLDYLKQILKRKARQKMRSHLEGYIEKYRDNPIGIMRPESWMPDEITIEAVTSDDEVIEILNEYAKYVLWEELTELRREVVESYMSELDTERTDRLSYEIEKVRHAGGKI